MFDPHRAECEEDYYYGLVWLCVPFTNEANLLLLGETAKQAFERLEIDGLQTHHETSKNVVGLKNGGRSPRLAKPTVTPLPTKPMTRKAVSR